MPKFYGIKAKSPIFRLLIHDWSKFTPWDFMKYYRKFGCSYYFDDPKTQVKIDMEFEIAWLHHQNLNPHHWEYWVTRRTNDAIPIKMPVWAVREMVADWISAGICYSKKTNER